jgi:DNA-binding CsgD family transcriptional regulator
MESHHAPELGPHLADLARHWCLATEEVEGERAAQWSKRAAEEAMRRLSYEEAARLYGLYISERTAQNHVQHILTKLGLANRTQIATWVSNSMSNSADGGRQRAT